MRTLLVSVVAFVALAVACASPEGAATDSAAAVTAESGGKVLLDCNVFESGGGPDQEVTVVENRDGSLTLKELTEDGDMVSRDLSADEWASGDLKLRSSADDGPDAVNRLYKDASGAWMDQAKSDGFDVEGNADCRR